LKCELIIERAGDEFSEYTLGPHFIDFCRGPHVPSTKRIKAFKLLSIAGAYWKGNEKNKQLQRIYGTAFFSPKDLDAYLKQLEEAKKRDHRKLGAELELYMIDDLAGPGLIFFLPKGATVRRVLEDWMRNAYVDRGYDLVHPARRTARPVEDFRACELYSENMFKPMELTMPSTNSNQ
jgi:threonyl-tRNA synthetase